MRKIIILILFFIIFGSVLFVPQKYRSKTNISYGQKAWVKWRVNSDNLTNQHYEDFNVIWYLVPYRYGNKIYFVSNDDIVLDASTGKQVKVNNQPGIFIPSVGNFDNDEDLELVAFTDSNYTITAYDFTYSDNRVLLEPVASINISLGIISNGYFSVVDLNGDGIDEVVYMSIGLDAIAVDIANSRILWRIPADEGFVYSKFGFGFGDFDGDGLQEAVFTYINETRGEFELLTMNYTGIEKVIYRSDLKLQLPNSIEPGVFFVIGDVNDDGIDDIVLWSEQESDIVAINGSGHVLWYWNDPTAHLGAEFKRVLMGDVNRDGVPEIVYWSVDTQVYGYRLFILNARNGELLLDKIFKFLQDIPPVNIFVTALGDVDGDDMEELVFQYANCPAVSTVDAEGVGVIDLSFENKHMIDARIAWVLDIYNGTEYYWPYSPFVGVFLFDGDEDGDLEIFSVTLKYFACVETEASGRYSDWWFTYRDFRCSLHWSIPLTRTEQEIPTMFIVAVAIALISLVGSIVLLGKRLRYVGITRDYEH